MGKSEAFAISKASLYDTGNKTFGIIALPHCFAASSAIRARRAFCFSALSGDGFEIWVDVETGVNYLWRATGYAGGLTVLLDRDGKPVITPVEK